MVEAALVLVFGVGAVGVFGYFVDFYFVVVEVVVGHEIAAVAAADLRDLIFCVLFLTSRLKPTTHELFEHHHVRQVHSIIRQLLFSRFRQDLLDFLLRNRVPRE